MKWEEMVRKKLEALLRREEPRDFFDLYFLIRARLGLKKIGALKEKILNESEFPIGKRRSGNLRASNDSSPGPIQDRRIPIFKKCWNLLNLNCRRRQFGLPVTAGSSWSRLVYFAGMGQV